MRSPARQASRMQKTFRKILLQLPGRCLDLPAEDKSMAVTKERRSRPPHVEVRPRCCNLY